MLQRHTAMNKLKYTCPACGAEYSAGAADTLIFTEDKKTYSLTKDGRTIWHYPSNQKVFRKCENPRGCKNTLVAWENDSELNKIYGCECGYSWKEYVTSS